MIVVVVVLVEVVEEVVVGVGMHLIIEFLWQDIVPLEQHAL